MRIKICGTTSAEDAAAAISSGADAVGFLIGLRYPAADEVSVERAREIVGALPPLVAPVLVTHATDRAWIADACREIGCNTAQIHGPLSIAEIPLLRASMPGIKIVKTVHVQGEDAIAEAVASSRVSDAILLDTKTEDRLGGTGKTHDWTISARIVRAVTVPVILAGGLNPENVGRAVALVGPWGVDVNSGVETPDGKKCPERIATFVANARDAERALARISGRP